MTNIIKSVQANLVNGLFEGRVNFEPGLNIISGENGTLKTKLLRYIRDNIHLVQFTDHQQPRIQSISPKRNAERKNIDSILQYFRQQNVNIDSLLNERSINDQTFENYPSLGDLYYVIYDELRKDGGNQREKMEQATLEVNNVIQVIFKEYKLVSEWDSTSKTPRFRLLKSGRNEVPLEGLSLGEQEILALVVNLYASRNKYDIFLIDEPEAHLNWNLEEKLFDFLDDFCNQFQRQIIVVTHSRAIFKSKFLQKTQFFYWGDEGKVNCRKNISKEQMRKIAGEAIEIIRLGNFLKPTFFVEDDAQQIVIESLAKALQRELSATVCGNSYNVISLFRLSKNEGGWELAYFLTDGDNEGNPYPDEENFFHLDKYCIENYLLDLPTASSTVGKSEDEIRQVIFEAINTNKHKILKKNKFFDFLFDNLQPHHLIPERLDVLDISLIFPSFLKLLDTNFQDYTQAYIEKCVNQNELETKFPKRLIELIRNTGSV